MKKSILLFLSSSMTICISTYAKSEEKPLNFALGVSTFGATITPRFQINNNYAVRTPIAYIASESMQDSHDLVTSVFTLNVVDTSDINILGGGGIIIDKASKRKHLNYSGGLMLPIYELVDQENPDTHFGIAPYAGLNYVYGNKNGLSLSLDAGAMYDLTAEGSDSNNSNIDKALSLAGMDWRTIPYFSAAFQLSF